MAPSPEELALQSADQIFIEGLWQELERQDSDAELKC